jgi:predicted dehydrogenase
MKGKLQRLWLRFKSNVAIKVSSLPSYESYSWGPKRSWTAWTLYHGIFVLRLLSPLQWWKFYKRGPFRPILHSTLDAKIRPDFHASDSERYLQFVLLGAIILWIARRRFSSLVLAALPHYSVQLTWIGWLILSIFLIESIQWTFYYALFRPLVERAKLNLYDEAEYLIMLPIVVLTQVVLLSILWNRGLQQTAMMMLNVNDPSAALSGSAVSGFPMSQRTQSLFSALLGQSYIVIVIASLIRVVPALHVRKRPNITVIGYGDVVRKRILPALLAVYHPLQLAIASDYLSPSDKKSLKALNIHNFFSACASKQERESGKVNVVERISGWADAHSKFAIVAVPTPSHLDYMLQLADRGIRFALEKPIVGTNAELDLLLNRSSSLLFDNIFVLSYYWLEKGLSLNYLLTLNPHYRQLLECVPAVSMQETSQALAKLGKLQDITVEFLEGDEPRERYWTELQSNGGMVMETLVHPLTFVVNFARQAKLFSAGKEMWTEAPHIRWRRNQKRASMVQEMAHKVIGPTFAEIHGSLAGGITVHLRCGKYAVDPGCESRYLIATYERGWITTDLSRMVTRVIAVSGTERNVVLTISNKDILPSQIMKHKKKDMALKYKHQIDLMNSFFVDGWGSVRFDDYPSQLDVLRELTKLSLTIPDEKFIENDDGVKKHVWIQNEVMMDPGAWEFPSE